jgi:hypothetical protein
LRRRGGIAAEILTDVAARAPSAALTSLRPVSRR